MFYYRILLYICVCIFVRTSLQLHAVTLDCLYLQLQIFLWLQDTINGYISDMHAHTHTQKWGCTLERTSNLCSSVPTSLLTHCSLNVLVVRST